jgi:hypothetical protein
MPAILNPIPSYFDTDGTPLQNGFLWFGPVNGNPETTQQAVYWDAALTQPAAQPVRTKNGMPSRNGSPGVLYIGTDYSQTVKNSKGELVSYLSSSASTTGTPALANGSAANPSLAFQLSPTTGIFSPGANAGGLSANGTERLRWTALGVGIGGTPAELLDVFGTTRLRGTLTVTTGGITVTAGGVTVAAGGVTVQAGGATVTGTSSFTGATTFTGNTTVAGGTFTTRGFEDLATTLAWRIDATGRLRNPGNTQLGFSARRTASQGSAGTIVFTDTGFAGGHNRATMLDTGTGAATIPAGQGGDYLATFSGHVVINAAGGAATIEMRVNGTQVHSRTVAGNDVGANAGIVITTVLTLNAGDVVTAAISSISNATLQANSNFAMRQLG